MTTEPESVQEGAAIWEAIRARLEGEQHRGVFVAPMARLLDQLQERVDGETWALILDLELRAGLEVMAGAQIGLELGYERGRAAALVEAQHVPNDATTALKERLVDLLGDTSIGYHDMMAALLAALHATVTMARGGLPERPTLRVAGVGLQWGREQAVGR